jgi:hypothetical protein
MQNRVSPVVQLDTNKISCTKPGGYVESVEFDIQFTSDDGTIEPGDTMYDWSQMFINAGETMGQTFLIGKQSKELITQAGFVDVVETRYKLPIGPWMADKKWKELGRWNLLFLMTGLEGMQLWILKTVLGVSQLYGWPWVTIVSLTLLSGNTQKFKLYQDVCAQLFGTKVTTGIMRCQYYCPITFRKYLLT